MEQKEKFLSILLYPLSAFLIPLPRTFIVKRNVNNGRNPHYCFFSVIAFFNEEATGSIKEDPIGAINEAAIGTIIAAKNSISCFLFHVLLFFSHTIN